MDGRGGVRGSERRREKESERKGKKRKREGEGKSNLMVCSFQSS